jgi:hypothetical protein
LNKTLVGTSLVLATADGPTPILTGFLFDSMWFNCTGYILIFISRTGILMRHDFIGIVFNSHLSTVTQAVLIGGRVD